MIPGQVVTRTDLLLGRLIFTPAADENGAGHASFGFTVSDGDLDSAVACTMTVDVTAVNDRPTASGNAVTTDEDTAYTFTATDFGVMDVEGDALAGVQITAPESKGDLEFGDVDVTEDQVITKADIDGGYLTFTPGGG